MKTYSLLFNASSDSEIIIYSNEEGVLKNVLIRKEHLKDFPLLKSNLLKKHKEKYDLLSKQHQEELTNLTKELDKETNSLHEQIIQHAKDLTLIP